MAERQYTKSGAFVVFHQSDAGAPELFNDDGGDWYFEPSGVDVGDVFSPGYPTPGAALAAAEEWEERG